LVVLGMMGRSPFGGQTWLYLNWLLGLARLGHDVWYAEDDFVWPYDPVSNQITDDCTYAVDHIASSMARIGMENRCGFRFLGRDDRAWGLTGTELDELYRSADALLNICGNELQDAHRATPFRVYVETDPVSAELCIANGEPKAVTAFADHHVIATYGENYGAPDCGVPLADVAYIKTRQPIDLSWWPVAFDAAAEHFTTIGNYRQRGRDLEYQGEVYRWSKHHEWEKFVELPSRVGQPFNMALKAGPADAEFLGGRGWTLVPPLPMSLDVFGAYPDFIRRSRAEFTVAKDQNVRLRSGWFSERDACYLASGKPVVAQDTGFSNVLPHDEGLFAFSTVDDAIDAIDAINDHYEQNCLAARAIAEEHFETTAVVSRFLHDLGLE
jgi:hypothetical protein